MIPLRTKSQMILEIGVLIQIQWLCSETSLTDFTMEEDNKSSQILNLEKVKLDRDCFHNLWRNRGDFL